MIMIDRSYRRPREYRCADGFCGALDCERCHPGGARQLALDDYCEAVNDELPRDVPNVDRDYAWEAMRDREDPATCAEGWAEYHREGAAC